MQNRLTVKWGFWFRGSSATQRFLVGGFVPLHHRGSHTQHAEETLTKTAAISAASKANKIIKIEPKFERPPRPVGDVVRFLDFHMPPAHPLTQALDAAKVDGMDTQIINLLRGILAVMGLCVVACSITTLMVVGPIATLLSLISAVAGIYLIYCSFRVERYIGSIPND